MTLNPETVKAFKTLLTDPDQTEEMKGKFKPLKECIVKSEKVVASHILYKQYMDYLHKSLPNAHLPKVIFYIIINEVFGHWSGQDEKGNAGWHLELVV